MEIPVNGYGILPDHHHRVNAFALALGWYPEGATTPA